MIHFDESSWKTIWSQQICTHPLCLLLWDQVSAEWCSSERSLHGVLHNWAPARASPQEQKQCSHRVGVGVCVCVCWGSEGRRGGVVKAVVCLSSHALTQLIITLCTSGRRSLISSALLKREITACPCFWQQSLQPHITEELIGWRRPIYHPLPLSYWSTLISLIWRNNIFQHFLNLIDDHDFFLWLTFTHSFSCFCSKFVASFVVVLSLSDLTFILVEW